MDRDTERRAAATHGASLVESDMIVGLGSGRTAEHMIHALGARVRDGLRIAAIPTSEASRRLALHEGIPVVPLDADTRPDLTIDGADEVDRMGNLIKGGGGALLREKIVAFHSRRRIIIVDSTKVVERLGRYPLAVEIVPFGAGAVLESIRSLGAGTVVRLGAGGEPYLTDSGNLIVDCAFGSIESPVDLADELSRIPGVVEHGLFVGAADLVIEGTADGVRSWKPPRQA